MASRIATIMKYIPRWAGKGWGMYEAFSKIFSDLSFYPVLALGSAAAISWIRIGQRKKLYLSWWWYVIFFAIVALSYYLCYIFEKNSRDSTDLNVSLRLLSNSSGVTDIAVNYKNKSSTTILVYSILYRIDGADSFSNNRPPVKIGPGSERSLVLGELTNPLVQRAAIVNVNFKFDDGYLSTDNERILKCDFSLSSGLAGGADISPEDCQEVSENTISPRGEDQYLKLLSQRSGRFVVSLPDNEGGLYFKVGIPPGWVFTYTPANRKASLVRGHQSYQIGAVIDVGDTPDHKHRFEGVWDDASRQVYLTADGEGKWFNIPKSVWDTYAAEKFSSSID